MGIFGKNKIIWAENLQAKKKVISLPSENIKSVTSK